VLNFANVATLADIFSNAGNLSIPLYVKRRSAATTDRDGEVISLRSAWDKWQAEGRAFWLQMDALVETLDGLSKAEDTQ